jgi:hypothetical protein
MAVLAMRLQLATPPNVLQSRNRLKVVGSNTEGIATKVVEL